MAEFIRRVQRDKSIGPADPQLPGDFCTRFPAMAEYLAVGRYPDGAVRQRSTITIMAGEGSGFKAVLNDRDNARSLWATAMTADGLFVSLEALLCDPNAPWRADKQGGRK